MEKNVNIGFMIIKKTDENSDEILKLASKLIKKGDLVILPFDTVYGIACNPFDEKAVKKIFLLKERPFSQTIGLAADSVETVLKNIKLEKNQKETLKENLPGKISFILPSPEKLGFSKLCIKDNTILMRVPNSRLIQDIAREAGGFIAQTSANKSAMPFCINIEGIKEQFGSSIEGVSLIIDGGEIADSKPSKIIDLTKEPRIVRE